VPIAEISLAADVRSAGAARRFLAAVLSGWAATAHGDDAVLLLSELVANAALHAGTEIGVRIELKPDCVRLSVTDGSPREPVLRRYSDEATTGRGLNLVSLLARQWGVDPNPDGGKTVWAEVGLDEVERPVGETTPDLRLIQGGGQGAPVSEYHRDETTTQLRGA
jgi:anti-sigma regulatory factor (Ser/Thr protein kinase)